MKKYPEESIKKLMGKKSNRPPKSRLCRYHVYGHPCPFEKQCHFIHDPDIKEYIKWITVKTKENTQWTTIEEDAILKAHNYTEPQI